MKRIVCFTMALLMVLSCMAISAAAYITSSSGSTSATSGTAEDIVITPISNTNGKVRDIGWSKTTLKTTVFGNRYCFELGYDADKTTALNNSTGGIELYGLNIPVKNYNYILVNCYYENLTGTVGRAGMAATTSGTNVSESIFFYQHRATPYTLDTRMGTTTTGKWITQIIPIYLLTDGGLNTGKTMSEDGMIHSLNLYMYGDGGTGTAPVYISSIRFTQDKPTGTVEDDTFDIAVWGTQEKANDDGNNNADDDTYNIRFVATVDSKLNLSDYSKLGFRVKANVTSPAMDTRKWEAETSTVYTSINGGDKTFNAKDYGANYLSVFEVTNVPKNVIANFEVVPYLKQGETMIYGVSANVQYKDGARVTASYFEGGSSVGGTKVADSNILQTLEDRAEAMKNAVLGVQQTWNTTASNIVLVAKGDPLSKANNATNGQIVLFERGGEWRGVITPVSGVTYSNYGDINKPLPIINGSAQNYIQAGQDLWIASGISNVWQCTKTGFVDVGLMAFNHSGELGNYNQTVGKLLFHDQDRSLDQYDLNENMEFYCSDAGYLYLYYDQGDPDSAFSSIEIGEDKTLFNATDKLNITVDGLHFRYTGGHAIDGGGQTSKNLTVQNCVFDWIGGSRLINPTTYMRYGNAIQAYNQIQDFTVKNNWCYQIYDTGITFQIAESNASNCDYKGITISDNLVEYTHWSIEAYNQASTSNPSASRTTENVLISGNMCRFGGEGWGTTHRASQYENLVDAALFITAGFATKPTNFVVCNNVFDRSTSSCGLVELQKGEKGYFTFSANTYVQNANVDDNTKTVLAKLYTVTYDMGTEADLTANLQNVIGGELGDKDGTLILVNRDVTLPAAPAIPAQAVQNVATTSNKALFVGTTTQNAISYQIGDVVVFDISLQVGDTVVSCDTIAWEAYSDDGKTYRGTLSSEYGKARIALPASAEGFIRLKCLAYDANGQLYTVVDQSTEINAVNMFGAGVNVDQIAEKYQSEIATTTFNQFWDTQLATLDTAEPEILAMTKMSDTEYTKSGYTAYRVKIACDYDGNGQFVTGYLTVPNGKTAIGINLYFYGYGHTDEMTEAAIKNGNYNALYTSEDAATFMVYAHSKDLGAANGYAELNNYGMSAQTDPTKVYFRDMILRDVQALRWAKKYFESQGIWNGKIHVSGGSQGGFQAIAVSALCSEVTSASYNVPWLCDMGHSTTSSTAMQSVFRPAYTSAMAYFDSVHFAERISARATPMEYIIIDAGLGDYVCPSSGIMALYNALSANSVKVTFEQGCTHGTQLPESERTSYILQK